MQVKLYLAPTVSVLSAFLRALPAGAKRLIFCEDRLTLEAERAVASRGAAFDTRVTTFARFIGGERRVLSKQGSVLAVGAILSRLAGQLRYFGPLSCAAALYETIAQLRAALVTPEMLEAAQQEADTLLCEKLADIALVYRAYLDFLAEGYVDESGVLSLLPDAVRSAQLAGTEVWFVGFSSFTRQAAEGIRAAIAAAGSVSALLIGGEEALYAGEAAADFTRCCRRAGHTVQIVPLPSGLIPEAEALRRSLFDPVYPQPLATDRVRLFAAADEEDEMRFVAAAVRAEAARGVRYGEMSLFLPDLSAYAVPLSRAFSEYHIPYYADVRKSAFEHPLSSFVLGWSSLLAGGFEPSDTDAFLANPFFGVPRRGVEAYRGYLLRYANYRGGAKRPVKDLAEAEGGAEAKAQFEALRERLLSLFEGAAASMRGAEYCRLVRRLMQLCGCAAVQEELSSRLEEEGLRAEAAYFARGAECMERVLAEAEQLAGNMRLSADDFAAMLGAGLKELKIALIPQYLDAVFVGSYAESRRGAAKVVFAAGLTDAVPACGADNGIITDKDIDRLRSLEVEIAPKIREVNARARENTGLALCGFSERLYLSRPAGQGGAEVRPSSVFQTVTALFTDTRGEPVKLFDRAAYEGYERRDPAAFRAYLAAISCERVPAVRELLSRADEYRRGRKDFSAHTGLLSALREKGDAPAMEIQGEQAFAPAAAQLLLGGKETVAPTLIEGYFACPYRNFAERGLRLQRQEEKSVRALDAGNYMHELLRLLAPAIARLPDIPACEAFMRARAEELLSAPPYCYLADTGAGSFAARALVEEAVVIGRQVFEQVKGSAYTVAAAEQSFGYPGSPIGGIPLRAGGRTYTVAGKIDRIDRSGEYVRVVDYKTGRMQVKPTDYYTGRKLQLELYLSAASAGGKPAGAYYFPARVGFVPPEEKAPFRMEGFTAAEEEIVRLSEPALQAGEESRFIAAKCATGGRGTLREEEMADFLQYAVRVSENCLKELSAGCIAPSPYAGECAYCPYGALCGRDPAEAERSERTASLSEIVDIVRSEREGQ